jgi:hypothetical protein
MVIVCCAFGDAVDSLRVQIFAPRCEDGEVGENVVLRMASNPGSIGVALLAFWGVWRQYMIQIRCVRLVKYFSCALPCQKPCKYVRVITHRISLNILLIILCSACRTAMSSPLASHSHWASAGCEQIAQSGSMILMGLLDLLLFRELV